MSENYTVFADFGQMSLEEIKKQSDLKLCLELGLDGFTYAIVQKRSKEIAKLQSFQFQDVESFEQLVENVLPILTKINKHKIQFDAVIMMLSHQYATFVPKVIDITDNIGNVLDFNFSTPFRKMGLVDEISSFESNGVFAIPEKSMKIQKEFEADFDIIHAKSVILKSSFVSSLKDLKDSACIINIREHFFDIFIFDFGHFKFSNSYEYSNKEEFMYFILATFKELAIDYTIFPLRIMGRISKDSPLFANLQRFFDDIKFLENKSFTFAQPDSAEQHPPHFFYNLLNLVNCVS